MIGRRVRVFVCALIGSGLASMPTLKGSAYTATAAQIGAAALAGRIVDRDGGALPGATVTVESLATGLTRTVVARADGEYVVQALPPGTYRVRAELNGFRPLVREGIRVATGETVPVDLQLQVGGVTEAITVTADAPLLRTETASLGTVIDQEKIVALPLNGRTFITLAGLAPGVALPPGSLLPRINGGRPRTNEYLFDGISVLQPEPGQVAFFPILDSIHEFKVESNSPPAEFGRFNGGIVNLTTKAGTNAFHGTAFEFFRHDSLNARNYFQRSTPVRPEYRRDQFGGNFGGPIRRNSTFFFVDYQGQRQNIARTVTSTVPTELQRQGIFTEAIAGRLPAIFDPGTTLNNIRSPFPNNTIPQDRWDPVARSLLARFPMPTSAGTANNYRRTAGETVDHDQFTLRGDHHFGPRRDAVFARFTRFAEEFLPVTPYPDGSGTAAGALGPQKTTSYALATNYRSTYGTSAFNEVRVGDTRRSVARTASTLPTAPSSSIALPGIPANAQFPNTLPTFTFGGAYGQIGSPPNTVTDFGTSVTQVADTFAWQKGRHAFKFGGDVRWERLNVVQPPSPTGVFTFSSLFTDQPGVTNTGTPLASFLLGQAATFSIDLQQEQIRNRAHIQEYFVQDDWRINDRITVNAGLRYTLNFPSTEENNQVAVFNLETRQLEYAGRDGNPRAVRELHKDNFGPRLGVAGQIDDKTVARSGYAKVWIEMAGITTPFTTPVFPFLQTVSLRTLDNINPALVLANGPTIVPVGLTPDAGLGQGVFGVDRSLGSGYAQQWNASVQRELGANMAVEFAYFGSHISNVGLPDTNINQLPTELLSLGSALTQRVPNPYFGIIPRSSSLGDPTIPYNQLLRAYPQFTSISMYRNNTGTTNYRGFSAKLEQRLSHGLSYLVSYTRSTLKDDASSVFDASILTGPVANYPVADSFDWSRERDYSTGDIPHVFAVSGIWIIPVGRGQAHSPGGIVGAIVSDWSLAGALTMQSGVPIAVSQATNNNLFAGFGMQRPDITGDPELPAGERSESRWFDTSAFSMAPQFTLGNASRNPVRGPSYRNLDLALSRRVPMSAGTVLEVRAEAFNVTNTTQFGAPNGSFGSAAFGTITTAADPRVIQVAVKVIF
jgi:hypothetical protein